MRGWSPGPSGVGGVALAALAGGLAACGGDSTGPPLSEISPDGTFAVTVSTTGAPADVDTTGYRIVIDTLVDIAVGIDTTVDVTVRGGVRDVLLDDVQENCAVDGDNPVRAEISIFEANAPVAFSVTCAFLGGSIRVVTATTGSQPDPDGYTVDLDGADSTAVAVAGEVTWTDVRVGTHTVTLSGLDGPCAPGDNPVAVVVAYATEAEVRFDVVCEPPGAS